MFKNALIFSLLISVIMIQHSYSQDDQNDELRNSHYITNQAPLAPEPYVALPIGAIKPKGWLLHQLETMRDGLTGNLDEVYSLVCGPRNGWLGGDGDGWERGPYWIDGLLPLAYILEDEAMIEKVKPWVEWSIENQRDDGYFGPIPFEDGYENEPGMQKGPRRDWWPKMVMLKVLQQYYMATEDERVIDLMTNYFKFQLKELPQTPLGHWTFWGNRRGGDNMMVVYWLYNITGDEFLLELAELLFEQTHPWTDHFLGDSLTSQKAFHCVNFAQGLKQPVIYYQHHTEEKYAKASKKALHDIQKFHGQAQGMYGGDEPLHGKNPTQGSEFCSAIELMFSLEKMIGITGDVEYADHLEKVAFNALPTQANDDFTARQYYQQANQVMLTEGYHNFYTDDPYRIVYGVLTGYPCCTTNMHQGWPKFTQHLWYATQDNGIAAIAFSPSEVTAKVADGQMVHIIEDTNYPFEDNIKFTIKTESAVEFPFHLRIPSWCVKAAIQINGELHETVEGGQIVKLNREWKNGDIVELSLPMQINTSRWYEDSVAIERGPLVYALRIGEDWKQVESERFDNNFYEVHPTDDWNYGILDSAIRNPNKEFIVVQSKDIKPNPWNLENAPIKLITNGKRIPDWTLYNEMAGPLPCSPQYDLDDQEIEEITLIPYGCTTLRISEFPVVR